MTADELLHECTRRAGIRDDVSPRDLVFAARATAMAIGKASRVSAFVLTWADAQLEHGGADMTVEDFIALRGHRRTTFRRRQEFRELFPEVELAELAWSVASHGADAPPEAAAPRGSRAATA